MRKIMGNPMLRALCALALSAILHVRVMVGLYEETLLFTSGQTVDAVITSYEEERAEGEFNDTFYSSYDYEFRDDHGLLVQGSQAQEAENPLNINTQNCPCQATVVYLVSDSSINSLKMPGSDSWIKFIWNGGFLWTLLTLSVYALVAYQVMRYFYPTEKKTTLV